MYDLVLWNRFLIKKNNEVSQQQELLTIQWVQNKRPRLLNYAKISDCINTDTIKQKNVIGQQINKNKSLNLMGWVGWSIECLIFKCPKHLNTWHKGPVDGLLLHFQSTFWAMAWKLDHCVQHSNCVQSCI